MNNWPDNNQPQPTWNGMVGVQPPDTQPPPPTASAPAWRQAGAYPAAPTMAAAPPAPAAPPQGTNFAPGQPPQWPPQSPPLAVPQQQWPQQPTQHYGGAPGPVPPKGNRNAKMFASVGAAVLILLMGVIGYVVTRDDGKQADEPTATTEAAERTKPRTTKAPTTEPVDTEPPATDPPATEPPATEPPTTAAPDTVPTGTDAPTASGELTPTQQAAAEKAAGFLEFMPASRAGLIDLLTYDDEFTEEDAAIGIDSLNVDWNEQALLSAASYLSLEMGFSHDGLYEQLTSEYGEEFTAEQAAYGVDNVEVDWNEQAVFRAESVIEYDASMSCEDVVRVLTDSYLFSPELAQYGATEAGAC